MLLIALLINTFSLSIYIIRFFTAFEKTLFGEFINGVNAGGQVSNQDSYQLNPQYLIIVPDTGRYPIKLKKKIKSYISIYLIYITNYW